jgi:hypothetical protein
MVFDRAAHVLDPWGRYVRQEAEVVDAGPARDATPSRTYPGFYDLRHFAVSQCVDSHPNGGQAGASGRSLRPFRGRRGRRVVDGSPRAALALKLEIPVNALPSRLTSDAPGKNRNCARGLGKRSSLGATLRASSGAYDFCLEIAIIPTKRAFYRSLVIAGIRELVLPQNCHTSIFGLAIWTRREVSGLCLVVVGYPRHLSCGWRTTRSHADRERVVRGEHRHVSAVCAGSGGS